MSITEQQPTSAPVTNWASGNWTVTEGNEETFVARWQEFLEWTRAEATGFVSAHLVRDRKDPRHFISVAQWVSVDDTAAWRLLPGFGPRFSACRELCDDLHASDYIVDITV